MAVVTLLTDFGIGAEYAGLMKGVILSISPTATIVDISHHIRRQDIEQAAFAIHSSYRYFPAGTVHLIVVDPGVGGERSLLALSMQKQFFIAPDNGVLSLLIAEKRISALVRITNSSLFLKPVSRTFHGRDIIAPVGARVANGVHLTQLGPPMAPEDAVCLNSLHARVSDGGEIVGKVVFIDDFGNLITNIDFEKLSEIYRDTSKIRIRIRAHVIFGLSETYETVPSHTPLALVGSRGYLEIAVNKGNAARMLMAGRGDHVWVGR